MRKNMKMAGPRDPFNDERIPASERTPLLPQLPGPPTTTNASQEGDLSPQNEDLTKPNQTITLIRGSLCTIALGFLIFLQATNISMLTTTQSAIASELDAFEKATWFTSAYLISMSSLSPLNGKLASLFGPRICIFVSTVVLALGTLASGVANTFTTFIFGRCITGIGASGIFTVSIIIVLELTTAERRGLAIGVLNSGYTFGVAVGATAAGALLPQVGWRALFWMQTPVALLGGTVLLLAIPPDFHAGGKKDTSSDSSRSTLKRLAQLDYLGALTLTTSIVLLLYALSASRTIPLLPILLSAVVMAAFVLNEVYLATDPIIPVTLLKSRGLLLTCLGTVGFMMSRWTVLFYAPTYALAVRLWSPATAGSILIPTNAGFAIGGLIVGWLHIRRLGSFWLATVVVYALFPFTLVILAEISTEFSSPALYVLAVFACGGFTGAALNYSLAHLLHLTPKETHYIGSSLLAMFRSFAGSFGSSIGGGLFTRTLYQSLTAGFDKAGLRHKEDLVRRLLGSPALVENLGGVEKEVAINGYQDALRMLFLAAAGLAGLMVILQAGTGWTAPEEKATGDGTEDEREQLVNNSEGDRA
jgi:MFS family permease